MRRLRLLVSLSLSVLVSLVKADVITLKNGDRLTGTIVKTDDSAKTVLMKTDLAGDVTISWEFT